MSSRAVVITTGTFLRGLLHIGSTTRPAGRMPSSAAGDAARQGAAPSNTGAGVCSGSDRDAADRVAAVGSSRLAQQFAACGFRLGRLKTGTPPRLDARTIDWARLQPQHGDTWPVPFSFLHMPPAAEAVRGSESSTSSGTSGGGTGDSAGGSSCSSSGGGSGGGWAPPLQQVPTYETRTTAATERFVGSCLAAGRGWQPAAGLGAFDPGGGSWARMALPSPGGGAAACRVVMRSHPWQCTQCATHPCTAGGCAEPRYCPSLETKFRRFAGRSHTVRAQRSLQRGAGRGRVCC